MKLIFNHNDQGKTELKKALGFLDAGFNYDSLEADIKLQTPYLIDLIGESLYNGLVDFYMDNSSVPEADREKHQEILDYMQIYIASMAYLSYAPNNDLSHSNSGRSFRNENNEKIPWEWQLKNSDMAISRRAYTALDHLFICLDKSDWQTWENSEAYQKANALFLKNTKLFEDTFPINKSGQLYYRLVPFMYDFEVDHIIPIITETKANELKEAESPSANQKILLSYIYKSIAYLSLSKAMKVFPVEMFPEGLIYNENTRMKSEARAEVMLFLKAEGEKYLKQLEHEFQLQNQTFEELKTTNGLEEGSKYVNL